MGQRVLVVDDEEAIVDFIAMSLRREEYEVLRAHTGRDALAVFVEQAPDLILLDLGLPDIDGFDVCRTIRETSQVPIIMVTARGDDDDKIAGLGLGSDDYVVKPFNPRELVARVKRMLARASHAHEAAAAVPAAASAVTSVRWHEIFVDLVRRRATVDERPLNLTPKEYDLLVYLVSNPERPLGRDELLREVWGSEAYDVRSVDVHVKYLREKLQEPMSACLQTVWGKGYKMTAAARP